MNVPAISSEPRVITVIDGYEIGKYQHYSHYFHIKDLTNNHKTWFNPIHETWGPRIKIKTITRQAIEQFTRAYLKMTQ